MRANFLLKKNLVSFLTDELVGKYHKALQDTIDYLIERNSNKHKKSSIGFKYNGQCYPHSTIKEQQTSTFALMELRSHPSMLDLHSDLHSEMQQLIVNKRNENMERSRCEGFLNYCISLCKTSTELKLTMEHVGLAKECKLYEEAAGQLYDNKDAIKELTTQQIALLNSRMKNFREFLDKIMVMRDLLGV